MAGSYDEDLADNPLFSTFKKDYTDLFQKVLSEGCTICIPRIGSLPFTIDLDYILAHIIYPSEEMPESHFQTLSGKEVKVCNRLITVEKDGQCVLSTKVLFEETYYSDDFLKYKVLCIEQPLEQKEGAQPDGLFELNTLRDCIEYLQAHSTGINLTEKLMKDIEDFCQQEDLLNSSLQTLKDLTLILCDKCLQIVLKNKLLREECYQNFHNLKRLKLAIETYVHHGISKILFSYVGNFSAQDDLILNKIIRNSVDITLRDMDIKPEYYNLIPKAKIELGKLSGYNTLLGKFNCLRKMMTIISRDPESGSMLNADDLLPIIIFVIIKTDITNWSAQLAYLKHFRYASNVEDENEFLVTTLEATIEHIKSGVFIGPSNTENEKTIILGEYFRNKEPAHGITRLFQEIAKDNLKEVQKSLSSEQNSINFNRLKLCHPLCVCEKCKIALSKDSKNVHPTVNSSNESGLSALLVASAYGKPMIIDYLLSLNADVHQKDENGLNALHYATMKGHQHAVLLLTQAGADVNSCDNSSNTPLHYCCMNGHEACVKALIYHSENESIRLLINTVNQNRDTPLHFAAKYGFISIVQILIENGADPSLLNKRKLTSFHVANNLKITDILKTAKLGFQCGSNFKTINFDFEDKTNALIPSTPEMLKKVNKMLRAIYYGDINLACFYLGLNPLLKTKVCHPLCTCANCSKPSEPTNFNKVISINMGNNAGITALHVAALHGHLELVELLVKNGANINSQAKNLATSLIIACQQQRLEIAKYLLDCGCNVNLQNNCGNTALHYACIQTHGRLVEILLKYKPNLDVRNKAGRTALQEAELKSALGIAQMLRESKTL